MAAPKEQTKSDIVFHQDHSTDIVHGSYENYMRKKPFPAGKFLIFLLVLSGVGYYFLKDNWRDHLLRVKAHLPPVVLKYLGEQAPGDGYVQIDGKYYKKSPDNVYIINGQRVYFNSARKPAANQKPVAK